jgi:hypothetical protein
MWPALNETAVRSVLKAALYFIWGKQVQNSEDYRQPSLPYIVGFLCISTTIRRYYPVTKLATIQPNPCHTVTV